MPIVQMGNLSDVFFATAKFAVLPLSSARFSPKQSLKQGLAFGNSIWEVITGSEEEGQGE